jgi:hypothetical protein
MTFRVVIEEEAEREFAEAVDFYDEREPTARDVLRAHFALPDFVENLAVNHGEIGDGRL